MLRSMFSAVSGLRNHQTMMDVVGNNISNVNTAGFKSSTTVFQDVLSQTLRGGGIATDELGGTNPAQVGLGSMIGAVTTNFSQGTLQRTSRSTDFAIQGDGFFVLEQGGQQMFTRAGSFSVDAQGRLVTQDGAFVQGWQADTNGVINANGGVNNVKIPVGDLVAPNMTTEVVIGGNLNSDAAVGTVMSNNVEVYDSEGGTVNVRFDFTRTATGWNAGFRYTDAGGTLQPTPPAAPTSLGSLTFNAAGELTSGYSLTIPAASVPGTGAITVSLGSAGGINRLTQYAGVSSNAVLSQNGSAAGSLQGFTVSQDGVVVGAYSNGRSKPIAQLALANFSNPEGLEKAGGSAFRSTVNSGLAQLGVPGNGGRGMLSTGMLEMSNVDLASEFTNLIVAQRGFQANSRVVTTSDELLQEVVNLKR